MISQVNSLLLDVLTYYIYNTNINFEWHDEKNILNFQKHGFSFSEATEMFNDLMIVNLDDIKEYGGKRYIGLVTIKSIVAVIVYTKRNNDSVRVISVRKANKREKTKFEAATKNRLETHKKNGR